MENNKEFIYVCRKSFISKCGKYVQEGNVYGIYEVVSFDYKLKRIFGEEVIEVSVLLLACNFIRINHDFSIVMPIYDTNR